MFVRDKLTLSPPVPVPPPQLLLDHQDAIAPEHNDPIHELLEDLGEVPTVESLIGERAGKLHQSNSPLLNDQHFSLRF